MLQNEVKVTSVRLWNQLTKSIVLYIFRISFPYLKTHFVFVFVFFVASLYKWSGYGRKKGKTANTQ